MPKSPPLNGTVNGSIHHEALDSLGSGFLTKAQQEVLDAAVLEKQKSAHLERVSSHGVEKSIGRAQSNPLSPKAKDRASRARSDKQLGKPKKGGAGGKFNWGGDLEYDAATGTQDPNDPNYDSDCEAGRGVRLETSPSEKSVEFASFVVALVKEYFLTGNITETTASLQALDQPEKSFYFAKKLVTLSLDHTDREREMASALLSALYSVAITGEQMVKAFTVLLESAEDLKLDVPRAPELLSYFIARAIIDDILPPAFVTQQPPDDFSVGILHKTEALLKSPHAAERMQKCWGQDCVSSYAKLESTIRNLLLEYVACEDKKEAALCVSNIRAPLAMHEVVKQALLHALGTTVPQRRDCILELIKYLVAEGHISEDQLIKGFKRVAANIDDLTLDIPSAKQGFAEICNSAHTAGWLPELSSDPGASPAANPTNALSLQAFKKASQSAILEYYNAGDAGEVRQCLEELNQPGFHSLVVKQVIQMAMEAKDREREMTAKLLCALSPSLVTADQLALGFVRLLATVEDLKLDIPGAEDQLELFLGRAIVDELLPPVFLTDALRRLSNSSRGIDVIKNTGKLLSHRHSAERMQACWHPVGDLQDLRTRIQDIIREFLVSGDESEAGQCWRDLSLAFYGHQLVVSILTADFEHPEKHQQLLSLIQHFSDSGELSQTQIQMGFKRVEAGLNDLKLDFPNAGQQFPACKEAALSHGWIDNST